jgi:hypothetical protein
VSANSAVQRFLRTSRSIPPGSCLAFLVLAFWNPVVSAQETGPSATVAAYCSSVGLAHPEDQARIAGFAREIEEAGLWSHLVDACFLRKNLQPQATQPWTLFGRLGTNIHSPQWDAEGVTLNGTNQLLRFTLPAFTNHTLVVVYATPTNLLGPASAAIAAVSTASGLGDAGISAAWRSYGTVYQGLRPYSSGAGDSDDGTRGTPLYHGYATLYQGFNEGYLPNDYPVQGYFSMDYRQRTIAMGWDGQAGIIGATEGHPCPTYTTACPPNQPLTELTLGGQLKSSDEYGSYLNARMIAWALFDTTITHRERHQAIFRALRWQDPQDENLVAYGDSLTYFRYYSPDNQGWFYNAFALNGEFSRWQQYNVALSGIPVVYQERFLTNLVYPLRPGGPVRKAKLYHWGGINDLFFNDSNPTNALSMGIRALSNVWTIARSWGFEVHGSTLTPVDTNSWKLIEWTPAMEWARRQFNGWIIAHADMVHRLHRRDLLFTNMNAATSPYSLDGLHFTPAGCRRIAEEVRTPDSYPFLLALERLADGGVRLRFASGNSGSFGVVAAEEPELPLAQWSVLGRVEDDPSGLLEFIDPGAFERPRRFYRVRVSD